MANKCIVCGKTGKDKRGKFAKVALIDDKFCSKPCSKRVKRMCKRIGCTETWYATEKSIKRYCRTCIPQSSSGPIYPYKLSKVCRLCTEHFTIEIHDEEQRKSESICNECNAVVNSRGWKCMRLFVESGISSAQLNKMNIETINWFYEELRETDVTG